MAELGLIQATRLGKMLGESHYAVARASAAAAKADPDLIRQAGEHLDKAAAIRPEFLTNWFAHDRYFDPVRLALEARWRQRAVGPVRPKD